MPPVFDDYEPGKPVNLQKNSMFRKDKAVVSPKPVEVATQELKAVIR